MRHLILAFVALLSAWPVSACINVYGTGLRGEKVGPTSLLGQDLADFLTSGGEHVNWRAAKARLGAKLATAGIHDRNDYAIALLHLGETARAIEILSEIEKVRPGLYATATNLGTAYELAGDNYRALHWIREGVRRNPASHAGSEWLHVTILETKLNLAADPRWLEKNSILAMGFGSARVPRWPRTPRGNHGRQLSVEETREHIEAQLRERLQFVKPPEPIVGDILFDFANLLMRTDALESADAVYALAIRYSAPRAELAKQRRAWIAGMLGNKK